MRLFIQIVFVSMLIFIIPSLAQGQINRVTVSVDGMSCPFCAYGVEKKLKKVGGVDSITISMKEGTATLEAREGESINISQVPKAIRDAGFTPGKTQVTASGYIKMDKQQRLSLQFSRPVDSFLLVDIKDKIKERLLAGAQSGKLLKIAGIIRERSDGTLSLSPQVVEEISK